MSASASPPAIDIHADGACKGNPGPGGWGALLVVGDEEHELFGGEPSTTNNRMELTAVIRALESLDTLAAFGAAGPAGAAVRLHTDSQYVQLGITEWIHGWKRRGWRTADRKPVKNADLWMRLDQLAARRPLEWHWVRGHAGHPGNERADALANRGVAMLTSPQRKRG
jgi:ribonuclease HI